MEGSGLWAWGLRGSELFGLRVEGVLEFRILGFGGLGRVGF